MNLLYWYLALSILVVGAVLAMFRDSAARELAQTQPRMPSARQRRQWRRERLEWRRR